MGRGQNINETACRSKNIVNIYPGSRTQKNKCRNLIMSWWAHYYLLSTHLAALDRRNKSFDRRGYYY